MTYDTRHGGPYDRGSADAYYRHQFNPHYFVGATHASELIKRDKMTDEEIAAYTAGYNEEDRKDW